MSARFSDPREVSAALGIPFSGEQLSAIAAPLEPGVIIAGAGTGKTTVMAARVVWLIGTGQVRPEQVLGLTFTRKAAGELADRVAAALVKAGLAGDADAGEQTVLTYDAFAGAVLAEHGARLGMDAELRLLGPAQSYLLAGRAARSLSAGVEELQFAVPTITERLAKLDAELAAHLVTPERVVELTEGLLDAVDAAPGHRGGAYRDIVDVGVAARQRLELLRFVESYRALKRELGVTEFADQLSHVARLVAALPAVGAALRERYRVVLLDEYQDTSAAQVAVLRGLFSGEAPESGRGFPVTAVGDPLQAIYGWRGAAAANILTFARDFPRASGAPAAQLTLRENRRSAPRILDVANALSRDLRSAGAGNELIPPAASVSEAAVSVGRFLTRDEELDWLGERIVALHGASVARGGVARWSDIAVLTRTNSDAGQVYQRLAERDVPVEIVGLGGLLDVPEVADVIATLRLLSDVTANSAAVRLLTGPRWRLSDPDLTALGARARELLGARRETVAGDAVTQELRAAVAGVDAGDLPSLLDAVADPGPRVSPAARERCARFAAELQSLREHSGDPLLELTRRVIAALGLDVELMATPELIERGGRRQLTAFVDHVADFAQADAEATLPALLGYLDAAREREDGLEQAPVTAADAVKLMTVHRAKGLEWEAVFLPGLVAGKFPQDKVSDNWLRAAHVLPAPLRGDAASVPQLAAVDRDSVRDYAAALKGELRAAEDRLAYVAASRAKRVLALTMAFWQPELKRAKAPSPYLDAAWDLASEVVSDVIAPGETNPCPPAHTSVAWAAGDPERFARKRALSRAVTEARRRFSAVGSYPDDEVLTLDDEARIAAWDGELEHLLAEARRARSGQREVALPASLTASDAIRASRDASGFAADLLRRMPRPPARWADVGTRFHAWVERRFAADSLPGLDSALDEWDAADGGTDDAAVRELCDRFAAGTFGERVPHRIEQPFILDLGLQLRGRIDAVYRDGAGWLVVDWKTGHELADPLQLAIYRVAWAELAGVPLEQVRAGFHYVRDDRFVPLENAPSRAQLARMIAGLASRGPDAVAAGE